MTAIERLQGKLTEEEGYLVITPVNRRYLTGFPSSLGYLLISREALVLFLDGRYYEAGSKAVPASIQVEQTRKLSEQLAAVAGRMKIQKVYTETEISVRELEGLRRLLPNLQVEAKEDLTATLESIRSVKSAGEADCIRRAQRMAEAALEEVLGLIQPGITESQIALELDYRMRKKGAEDTAFDTIAVTGPKSALPHGVPGDVPVQKGDFIVMDFGAVYGGYRSDMTRTVAVGYATDEMKKVYETVLAAQAAVLEVLRPGLPCAEGDRAAREVIEKAGYGEYFNHSTGHGVGLEIHEYPNLTSRGEAVLEAGQIVTVEPGIYLPSRFGVRIEDMVWLTPGGCENLTAAPKALTIL